MIEIVAAFIAFITTLAITPHLMRFFEAVDIVGLDMHKKERPQLPTSGGVCIAAGLLAGLLSYVGLKTFLLGPSLDVINLLAVTSSILIVTFVGLLDDIGVKRKRVRTKEGWDVRVGLPQWVKPLITLPAAVPLMVIMAGETTMSLPLLGTMNFGVFYPLILIPIGLVGASNVVNLLGGFNGCETGMGIVYISALAIYAFLHQSVAGPILLITAASLAGFIKYNWYPARILPGDSLTYLLGAVVAASVIVGNMERAGVIILTPFIIEFFLKARARFAASCLGKLRDDGKLDPPYGRKIYSLTHILMNVGHWNEVQITWLLILIQTLFAILTFMI